MLGVSGSSRCALSVGVPPAQQKIISAALDGIGMDVCVADQADQVRDALYDRDILIALVHFGRDVPQGEACCKAIRRHPRGEETPIVGLVDDSVAERLPLDVGIDDVAVIPFSEGELSLRVRLALWRDNHTDGPDVIKVGDVSIDLPGMHVRDRGKPVDLTYKEFALLRYLAEHPGIALGRVPILEAVWGEDYYGGDRTVDIHVRRLRAKIPALKAYIETVHGVGYRFTPGQV